MTAILFAYQHPHWIYRLQCGVDVGSILCIVFFLLYEGAFVSLIIAYTREMLTLITRCINSNIIENESNIAAYFSFGYNKMSGRVFDYIGIYTSCN